MSDLTLTLNTATFILVKIILQQNGHLDVTDDAVGGYSQGGQDNERG